MNMPRNPHESVYADVNRCRTHSKQAMDEGVGFVKHELIHRNWFEVRDKLRARFPILTPADVEYEPGKKSEMMRAIEQKLELAPCDLQRIIAYL